MFAAGGGEGRGEGRGGGGVYPLINTGGGLRVAAYHDGLICLGSSGSSFPGNRGPISGPDGSLSAHHHYQARFHPYSCAPGWSLSSRLDNWGLAPLDLAPTLLLIINGASRGGIPGTRESPNPETWNFSGRSRVDWQKHPPLSLDGVYQLHFFFPPHHVLRGFLHSDIHQPNPTYLPPTTFRMALIKGKTSSTPSPPSLWYRFGPGKSWFSPAATIILCSL